MPITRTLAVAAAVAMAALPIRAVAESSAPDAFRDRLAVAQGKLAVNLLEQLATTKKPMIVVSPASIAGAAATLNLGASAPLRMSLHTVLGFHPDADIPGDLTALQQTIDKLGASEGQAALPLKFANAIVFDDSVALYPGAAIALRQAGVDSSVTNLQAPETLAAINKRVSDRTGGLIPEILDRAPAGASLLVLNALHFKDRWKAPFDRAHTQPAPFKRVSGSPATVSTMHLPQGRYLFRQDAQFIGIELPYAQDRFSMVIVTTRGERPAPVRDFASVGEWLTGKGFALAQGELALPHFDVSNGEDLTPALDRLGLRTARVAPGSLAGFTADPANITRVVQRLELRLNEEGTQAAAATAAIAERGVDPNYVRMAVDKPFMFALRDSMTGLILMAGYVGEPTSLATAAAQ
jgi:serpin B